MKLSYKHIPFLSPTLYFLSLEIIYFRPRAHLFVILLLLSLIIGVVSLLKLVKEKIRTLWPLIIQSTLLILIGSFFSLFFTHVILYQLFVIMINFLYWFVLYTLFCFLYQPRLYRPHSLEKVSAWLVFVTVFCFSAVLSALPIFYNLPAWLALLPFLIFTLWSYFYLLWANKIEFIKNSETAVIFTLILTEFYFILNLLPLHFHLIGLILAGFNIIIFTLWQKAQKLTLPTVVKG
jgi:hypothetical protein